MAIQPPSLGSGSSWVLHTELLKSFTRHPTPFELTRPWLVALPWSLSLWFRPPATPSGAQSSGAAAVPPRAEPGSSHPIVVPAFSVLTIQIKRHRPDPASTSVPSNLPARTRVRTISGQHRHAGKICNRDGRSMPADRPRPPPHRRRVAPQRWLVPGDQRQVPEVARPGPARVPSSYLTLQQQRRPCFTAVTAAVAKGPSGTQSHTLAWGPSASSATSLSRVLGTLLFAWPLESRRQPSFQQRAEAA